ncbi:T9SS type A sorting domain-containing protein [Algivirga pacifica]|uniref:Por secretion system C-terminal sorting domain-containing protein n=1 Tax=Algivirga pacifica TaxID=1162670 RepID=A0ABP9D8R6_9BACT
MKSTFKILTFFLLFFSVTQAFAQTKWLYDGAFRTKEERLLAMGLAGIVNRDSSQLYLQNVNETWSYTRTDEEWAKLYAADGIEFITTNDINALVIAFKEQLNGVITYDSLQVASNFEGQQFLWQGEFAGMLGGLTDRLPMTKERALALDFILTDSVEVTDYRQSLATIQFPARLELEAHDWNNTSLTSMERYILLLQDGVNSLLPRSNPKKFYIRELTDYTVKEQMFQVNLGGTSSLYFDSLPEEKATIIEDILRYMRQENKGQIFHIYGWMRPEPLIQWFSAYGGSFHETLLSNMSWHTSYKVDQPLPERKANQFDRDSLYLEEKHYVLMIGSEGDAGNWTYGLQAGAWLSQERGNVPIGWGFNLHLLQQAPFIAHHYLSSATEQDGFLAVTTPLGYTYPDLFPEEVLDNAILESKALMDTFDIAQLYAYKHYNGKGVSDYRNITIDNSFNFNKLGAFNKAIGSELTFLFDPKLPTQTTTIREEHLLFNHVDDGTFYGDMNNTYTVADDIIDRVAKKTKPSFTLVGYQRLRKDNYLNRTAPENVDISLKRLKKIINLVEEDEAYGKEIIFVTPEKFANLLQQSKGIIPPNYKESPVPVHVQTPEVAFSVYPNPAKEYIMVKGEFMEKNATIEVMNIYGKQLLKQGLQGNKSLRINTSDWPKGTYLLRYQNGQRYGVKKVIVV